MDNNKFFSAISGQELSADLEQQFPLEDALEIIDDTDFVMREHTLRLRVQRTSELWEGDEAAIFRVYGDSSEISASIEEGDELETAVLGSGHDKSLAVFLPEDSPQDFVINVNILCTAFIRMPYGFNDFSFSNLEWMTPLTVINGISNMPAFESNFDAPHGMYRELAPVVNLSSGYYRPGNDRLITPSLFSEDSEHLVLRNGSIWNIDAAKDYSEHEYREQYIGNSCVRLHNVSVFSVNENRIDGSEEAEFDGDPDAVRAILSYDVGEILSAPLQSVSSVLDGIHVAEDFFLVRESSGEIPLFLDTEEDLIFMDEIFGAIDSSGNQEDHPFFFDASNLLYWIKSSMGFKQIFSSYAVPMGYGLPLEYFWAIIPELRVMLPSFKDAASLKVFSPIEENLFRASFIYDDLLTLGFSSGSEIPHLPTHFSFPELPENLGFLDSSVISAPSVLGLCVAFRKTQWIQEFGAKAWVFGSSVVNDYAIYREVQPGTKIVKDFNCATSAHLYVTGSINSDGTVNSVSLQTIPQPRLPEGVEYIFGYYENFLSGMNLSGRRSPSHHLTVDFRAIDFYNGQEDEGVGLPSRNTLFPRFQPGEWPEEDPNDPVPRHFPRPQYIVDPETGEEIRWAGMDLSRLPREESVWGPDYIFRVNPPGGERIGGSTPPFSGDVVVPALPESTVFLKDYMTNAFSVSSIGRPRTRMNYQYLTSHSLNANLGRGISTYSGIGEMSSVDEMPNFISVEEQHLPNLRLVDGWCVGFAGAFLSEFGFEEWVPLPPKASSVRYRRLFTQAFEEWRFPGSQVVENRRAFPIEDFLGYNVVDDESFNRAFNGNFYGNFNAVINEYGVEAIGDFSMETPTVVTGYEYQVPQTTSLGGTKSFTYSGHIFREKTMPIGNGTIIYDPPS